ncbi:MAG: hypothetical protein AMK74_03555 [Nitrospira bacterium SM23_35]|jgi:hypothetical protein|nr:MAG: hypothetical protein AMK74_03555 [Nitrospira bacterium SM23_35]
MLEKVINAMQGIVFERIFLPIVNSYSAHKDAKASEFSDPEIIRDRETRMGSNTLPCIEGMR